MTQSGSRRVHARGTAAFPGRSTHLQDRGFSRPVPAPDRPGRPKTEAGGCRAAPTWAMDGLLLLELHALARDQDRAHSYLARPGCNVLLGQAHLSRTMAKQTRILRFLRDSGHPVDWFRAPAGGPGRWATSRTRS